MRAFFKKEAESLGAYFERLADIEFPKELVFIGSGTTPPRLEWRGMKSVRFNDKTLDRYPEHPVFGVLGQFVSKPKILAHALFSGSVTPWFWEYSNAVNLEQSERRSNPPIAKYRLIGTKRLRKAERFNELRARFTTGGLVILFLVHSPLERICLAGYDGWKGNIRHARPDGSRWPGGFFGHDLAGEWRLIEQAIEDARRAGKTVEVATA